MIAILIGAICAIFIGAFAKLLRLDQDKSFYPTVLIVIASYYVLFAVMAGEEILREILFASIFAVIALLAIVLWPVAAGVGIVLHGLFDIAHVFAFNNGGVPHWWPVFCATLDILLGLWVIYISLDKGKASGHGA